MFAWDKHIKIWQLVGAVLAVPAGIAGTYSFYTTYVVRDVSCDSLRSSIIAVLDRNLDPEAKRALLRKDVADFDTHCGAKDPEAKVIFDAAIAPQQAAPAGMVQKQPAIAVQPTDFFGLSRKGERRGWISMFHRYADGHREANFEADGVPVTPRVVPPAVGTVLTALTMVSVWFEAPPEGQDNALSQLQGRIAPGSCIKVIRRGGPALLGGSRASAVLANELTTRHNRGVWVMSKYSLALTRRDVIGIAMLLGGVAVTKSRVIAQTRIPVIDTHLHLLRGLRRRESLVGQAQVALRVMDSLSIERAIITPPPFTPDHPGIYDLAGLETVARQYPRLAFMAGGGSLNPLIQSTTADRVDDGTLRRFRDTAAAIASAGAAGFGEFAVEHFSSGRGGHPYETAPADHPLFLALADIAAGYSLPVEIHMEAVPADMPFPPGRQQGERNPDRLHANIPGFERLLAHNPTAKIVWVHAGWDLTGERTPQLMTRLLREHPNLSMSIKFDHSGARRTAPMSEDESRLRPPWLAMLEGFPDRFVIGSDLFADEDTERLEDVRRLVDALPPALAPRIARENALRIYRLS